jgi:guanylate kinase
MDTNCFATVLFYFSKMTFFYIDPINHERREARLRKRSEERHGSNYTFFYNLTEQEL